jgi:hypothetical protein
VINFETGEVVTKAPTDAVHQNHGICMVDDSIFAFGGAGESKKLAEEYSIANNTWKNLPDITLPMNFAVCTVQRGYIFLTSHEATDVLRYDPSYMIYTALHVTKPGNVHVRLLNTGVSLIMILDDVSKEFDIEGKMLDTFSGAAMGN